MSKPTLAIASDHAGYSTKEELKKYLAELGYNVWDFGTHSDDSVDYPDFAHPVANAVEKGAADFGVLVCGSGNGVAITANKHQGIRAAICWNEDLARLARRHNNANIIAIPARYIDLSVAVNLVNIFLYEEFDGGRHATRVDKIPTA